MAKIKIIKAIARVEINKQIDKGQELIERLDRASAVCG
jgi:hypothetical protein